jgi:glycerol-3-phosphate dehydrogenase
MRSTVAKQAPGPEKVLKNIYDRESMVGRLGESGRPWDVLVVGGGASGLGAAVDAAARGYRTLLLEQHDFSKGTSSRSTKLVHGGVRYLAQGNISLVLEALRERGRLKKNAPHLVRDQSFVIPCYSWWCVPFYTAGLTLYDLMAGRLGIGRSVPLSKKKVILSLPNIRTTRLKGGVRYFDCQFDDSRLAVNLLQTLYGLGGLALNYMEVTGLIRDGADISGVLARDHESGREYRIPAKVVVNATGVFVDRVIKMADQDARDAVRPSQGIHLVLDRKFLKGDEALMIPRTPDGRVLFAVPWHNRLVVGTTDVEKQQADLEPRAEEEEVAYILETAGRFLDRKPGRDDVLSVFAGLRPLAAPSGEKTKTKEISRGHKIIVTRGGLITLTGGKWTTYRKMGEDVIDLAARRAGLPRSKSVTRDLKIHGYRVGTDHAAPRSWYGSDEEIINNLVRSDPAMGEVLSKMLHIIKAQVIHAIRVEMARTVEDFLARRTRALQLDARESIRMAPRVAEIMAGDLGHDTQWESDQVQAYTALASRYLLTPA